MDVRKLDAKPAAISKMLLDLTAQMAQAQDDATNSISRKELDLMLDEWPASDIDHRFRHRLRNRAEPRRKTARQKRHRHRLNLQRFKTHLRLIHFCCASRPIECPRA